MLHRARISIIATMHITSTIASDRTTFKQMEGNLMLDHLYVFDGRFSSSTHGIAILISEQGTKELASPLRKGAREKPDWTFSDDDSTRTYSSKISTPFQMLYLYCQREKPYQSIGTIQCETRH